MSAITTRFAGLRPAVARLVLLVLAAVTVVLVLASLQIPPLPETAPGRHGDLETYSRVIERLQHGEPYHQALHEELLANGYGTTSIFNWRPPFFLSFMALFPSPLLAQAVVAAVAGLGLLLAAGLVRRDGSMAMMVGIALLLVLCLVAVLAPHAELACELTAGSLILLSAAAYGLKLNWLGFAAALLALFTREIAAVYVVVCVALALRDRRWREAAAWGVGLAAFAVYYAWHYVSAMSLIGPADRAYPDGWLQWGGIMFDLGTASFNGAFLLLPYWVTAIYLPVAVLGLLAWPAKAAVRVAATVLGFLVLFSMFGKPVNTYWGSLYTPLLAFGLPWVPFALRDLFRAALPKARALAA